MDIPINDVQTVKEKLQQESRKNGRKNGASFSENSYTLSKYKNLRVRQYKGKRVFDLILGVVALFFCLILFPFIALGIKFSSKGKVFFTQKRTGQNGTPFTCYKFRTMKSGTKKALNGKP